MRRLLIAQWDHTKRRRRIPGHLYPYEQALKAGADVVVTPGRLARALEFAGRSADRFDDGTPDAGKPWLLGADGSLTEILDKHVAEINATPSRQARRISPSSNGVRNASSALTLISAHSSPNTTHIFDELSSLW